MKKVLCIVNLMEPGGAETFLMKILRSLDRNLYSMDFMTTVKKTGYYDDEIKRLGGKIYNMPSLKCHPVQSMYLLYDVVKRNGYETVMISTSSSVYAVLLLIAKIAGCCKTALRSTNSNLPQEAKLLRLLHKIFYLLPKYVVDVKIAPSKLAGEFMFGKAGVKHNFNILNNGIPSSKFLFSSQEREKIRKDLGIEKNVLLIGHIGRFEEQKNHDFLIRIFNEIRKIHNAKLVLIGKGSREDDIKDMVMNMHLENDVLFLGIRNDVPQLLMGMDGMIFPSLYEGMPNVIIEAQATGLPCLLSDRITSECKITDLVEFLQLTDSETTWRDKITQMIDKCHDREVYSDMVDKSGYGIENVKNKFVKLIFE
ncbi:putative glycosyl transferase family 1 protein [Selenomonas ruminantium subsp. lactilytica TAM6421]|uniref:Putative glycosyl transferase family 1 protein n=1 Tax=Selenomonas ruminantium subsp. lactilytica (strain NBRC 103574 / TAM6421) TaxID=927704 RepID=I0GUF8_SELRL|nr:glycosyltransferase family 1 protein [Selenomonas ruminantium]BAL84395.1 putative glycosyl transferase family 1 protein [Selenomonas ruminantium subsp. lactilytica TAM6421]